MTMRASSVSNLTDIKDVTEADAALIRALWKAESWEQLVAIYPEAEAVRTYQRATGLRQIKRYCVDKILNTCGIEHLGYDTRANRHVYYCNAGDAYATTVCFVGDSLVATCWSYYVERGTIKQPEFC